MLHVYSQGNTSSADFDFLRVWRPIFHVEAEQSEQTSAIQTQMIESMFHHMASADALIIARSALSRAAGYVSRGRVYSPDIVGTTQEPRSPIAQLQGC